MEDQITIVKVVTKNFIQDLIAKFQNMIGFNIKGYEDMIQKGVKQIKDELKEKNIQVGWYRYEMNQLSNGAMAIMFYGEIKK